MPNSSELNNHHTCPNNQDSNLHKQTSSFYESDMTLGPLGLPEYSNLALQRVTVVKDGRYIDLGTSGLMLNIITPLQKFRHVSHIQ